MLPLFEPEEAAGKRELAGRLDALAQHQVYIGTSSWKYEGWLGDIYTPERYLYRGKISRKKFMACVSAPDPKKP